MIVGLSSWPSAVSRPRAASISWSMRGALALGRRPKRAGVAAAPGRGLPWASCSASPASNSSVTDATACGPAG